MFERFYYFKYYYLLLKFNSISNFIILLLFYLSVMEDKFLFNFDFSSDLKSGSFSKPYKTDFHLNEGKLKLSIIHTKSQNHL